MLHKLVTEARHPIYVQGVRLRPPPSPTPPRVVPPVSAAPTVNSTAKSVPSPKSAASIVIPRAESLFSEWNPAPLGETGLETAGPFEPRLSSVAPQERGGLAEDEDSGADSGARSKDQSVKPDEPGESEDEEVKNEDDADDDDDYDNDDDDDDDDDDVYEPPRTPTPPRPLVFKGKSRVIDLSNRSHGQRPAFLANNTEQAMDTAAWSNEQQAAGGLDMQAFEAYPTDETGAGPGPSTMAARAQRASHETQRVAGDAALAQQLQVIH